MRPSTHVCVCAQVSGGVNVWQVWVRWSGGGGKGASWLKGNKAQRTSTSIDLSVVVQMVRLYMNLNTVLLSIGQ